LKGNYPGGRPPYGLDVVCLDENGKERYRVIWQGHQQRVKVEGKKRTRYDGKDNVPAHDSGAILKLRPSVEKDRIKWVKQIFAWAGKGLSPYRIAQRLNEKGVKPVFGAAWYKQTIKQLLTNPVYLGLPTDNKRAGSRFYEYVDGQVREVEPGKGDRTRNKQDWWQPKEPEFKPLVAPKLFNEVQKLLRKSSEANKTERRPPKTEHMWLKGFLFCWKCGKALHANACETGTNQASYFDATYNRYGKNNAAGCRCHRVKHDVLEAIILRYMAEQHAKLAALIHAAETGDDAILEPLGDELNNGRVEVVKILAMMAAQMGKPDSLQVRMSPADWELLQQGKAPKQAKFKIPDLEAYQNFFNKQKPAIRKELAALDAEHDNILAAIVKLPEGKGVAKYKNKLAAVEAQMARLESALEDQTERLEAVLADLRRRKTAMEQLRDNIAQDVAYTRKRQLLGEVVDKIILKWRYGKVKSTLDEVEIRPISGGSPFVVKGRSLGPG